MSKKDSRPVNNPAPANAAPLAKEGVPLFALRDVSKYFAGPVEQLRVLQGISLDIQEGETVAIVGASGSGKSTLLHLLGTLASPSSGEVLFRGQSLGDLDPDRRAQVRNREMGFVFQFHHLLPEFSTVENVAMQAIIGGLPKKTAIRRALRLLGRVGLADKAEVNVGFLSGGERQRAAIARAILQEPAVLLADEPTGNLDGKTGRLITELLLELHADRAMSMIIVTHNHELAGKMGKCFELKSGELYEQTR